jgi:putative SOS response-associated peptidase YedK
VKQPFFIRLADGSPLPLAGLYEFWRDRTRADDDPLAWWTTCTILTTESTDDMGRLHDRMPMAVAPEHWDRWLDPDETDASGVMVPAGELGLTAYPVSLDVSNVRNNGPHLIDPLPPDQVLPGVRW